MKGYNRITKAEITVVQKLNQSAAAEKTGCYCPERSRRIGCALFFLFCTSKKERTKEI